MSSPIHENNPNQSDDVSSEVITSLKNQIADLEQTITILLEQNNNLAEFIRTQLDDILKLAKNSRDQYAAYATFLKNVVAAGESNGASEKSDVRLGDG